MKAFELKALGLADLPESEVSMVTGGGFVRDYLIGKVIDFLVDVTVESYKDGTQGEWYSTMISYNPYYSPLR